MAALRSNPLSATWMLLVSALCSDCAKVSSSDLLDIARSDGGVALDLALPPRDLTSAIAPDLTLAIAPDLAAPVRDLAPVDLGPFPPGAFYQISVKATGQLLSVHNSATTDGATVEEQPAHGTGDQRWSLTATATAGVYQIVNGLSQSCLDVNAASTADGATVWIWSCGSATSQQWNLHDAGGGFYNLINVNSNSCLDLDN
ncbi:MAG: glycoside hydrolase, partial [bacterium]|nr:glycoside hydrolase [bacterium]